MRIPVLVLAFLAGAIHVNPPLQAQDAPAQTPDSLPAASSYTSFAVEGQVTAASPVDRGSASFIVGRVQPLGAGGAWRPQVGVGLTTLFGQWVLDGVAIGPRLAIARAVPLGLFAGPRGHQLLIGATALVDGAWRFGGVERQRGTRLEPAVRAGLGYRFRPGRASWFTVLQGLVEGRRHVQGPTVYLSLGFENPRSRPQS